MIGPERVEPSFRGGRNPGSQFCNALLIPNRIAPTWPARFINVLTYRKKHLSDKTSKVKLDKVTSRSMALWQLIFYFTDKENIIFDWLTTNGFSELIFNMRFKILYIYGELMWTIELKRGDKWKYTLYNMTKPME